MANAYWLFKSEPDVFGIEHLRACHQQTDGWDGVRNYQARNFMQQMKVGDKGFFYHSNCKVPGIIGTVRISKSAYPDPTQFDASSKYYDPKSTEAAPRWYQVDVTLDKIFPEVIPLTTLKADEALAEMPLVRKGNRLSVMPVSENEWQHILQSLTR